jgi:predicted dehydrogenase
VSGIRAAVVGLGGISQVWLPPLRDRVEIVALVDPAADRTSDARERHGLSAPAFRSLDVALAATTPTLVVNLTPVEWHRPVTIAALDAGCDVMQEKPLAVDLTEANELIAAADGAGKTLAIMQNRRYVPGIQSLHSGIAGGLLGDVSFVAADMFLAHPVAEGEWRQTMASPLLVDMAIHTFDQARYLTGRNAVAAYCHEFNPPYSWYEGAASAICMFEMEGGVVFSYRGSWVDPGLATTYDAAWRINGSGGTAVWDGRSQPRFQATAGRPELATDVEQWPLAECRDRMGHAAAIDEFLDALEKREKPPTSADDNIQSLAMVFAALESAGERRRITLENGLLRSPLTDSNRRPLLTMQGTGNPPCTS